MTRTIAARHREVISWSPVARIIAASRLRPSEADVWAPVRRIILAGSSNERQGVIENWLPVTRMIEQARASQDADQRDLEELLAESKSLLSPLEDPFATDFGLHRWLRGSREEVYSDWLEWIMQGLNSAADVLWLLDLDIPAQAESWKNASVQREEPISGGRLDMVLRWPAKMLLVLEVKVTNEEAASTAKQTRYREWMDRQTEPNEGMLLVIDASPGDSEGGFRRIDWRTVCIRMRCMAAGCRIREKGAEASSHDGRAVSSALMLAFAGAVEQNLLEMPGRPLRLMKAGRLLNVLPVLEYLREFHDSYEKES